ncbi:MAG: YpsA SLOG family protein [Chthoniobacterales bacterium]
MKIISGGQTGVDRAALDVALSLGMECGGWCPEGRLDENRIIPARYPVKELPGAGFAERTAQNVADSDGTAIFYSGALRGGTEATARFCAEKQKPCELIDAGEVSLDEAAEKLSEFVRERNIRVLNVAGPRASEWSDGYDFASEALRKFLQKPELSFVVPAHNEEHELPETLRAIRAAADASARSYEVIVVDDASTDATTEIARQFGARIVPVNFRHIAAVRNAGARVARGDILFFVDADTRIAAGHVIDALACLTSGYVGGSARIEVDREMPRWARIYIKTFCTLYFAANLGAGAFLFTQRKWFETVGGFDEQFFAGEEVYLTIALKRLGKFKILREPIVTSARKVRMHSPGFVLAQSCFIIFGGQRALRNREKLGLWYDGRREAKSA